MVLMTVKSFVDFASGFNHNSIAQEASIILTKKYILDVQETGWLGILTGFLEH